MKDDIQRDQHGAPLLDVRPAHAGKHGALRASFREFENAPVGIVVVHGDAHTIVYANASFRGSCGSADDRLVGRSIRDVLEAASTKGLHNPSATEIVAILDGIRVDHAGARAVNLRVNVKHDATDAKNVSIDVSLNASTNIASESSVRGFWRCMAWPVRSPDSDVDELVVELWYIPDEQSSLVRQREIAERMLMSALRERALSEDNARLYEMANAARAAADEARLLAEQAQVRAEQAQHDAEAANQAKAQFLANMSHELRTPLNAIGGYAQLIEMGIRGAVTEAQLKDLARIRSSQAHLLGLINAVLNYAKLEAGRIIYDLESVVLDDAVVEAESLVDPQLHAKGLIFQYSHSIDPVVGSGQIRARVMADPQKLRQIVLNLLSNAIKYTAAGGTISVACRIVDGTAAVSVSDTGIGIPAAKLQTVFDPFVQLAQGLNFPDPGVGLGLAISRDLAQGMDGDLSVESVEGKGSTFTLVLPLAA